MSDIRRLAAQIEPYLTMQRMVGVGTAFPASADVPLGLQAGDRFFRSDLGWECYYDGTRWLTCHEYALPLTFASGGSGLPSYSAGLNTAYMNTASGYTAYWTRMACHTNAAATNNGSNYWTVTVQGINLAASAGTTIIAFDTSADTAGVRTNHSATVSAGNALPANNYFVSAILAKVGTPGNLEMTMVMHHKYVVT